MEGAILLGVLGLRSLLSMIVRRPSTTPQASNGKRFELNAKRVSEMCRYAAQNAHIIVIQVDFRLGPEHPTPAQVEDCTAAYKWVCLSQPHLFVVSSNPVVELTRSIVSR